MTIDDKFIEQGWDATLAKKYSLWAKLTMPNLKADAKAFANAVVDAMAAPPVATARFLPPPGRTGFGVGWTVKGNEALLAALPPALQPASRSVIWTFNTPMETAFQRAQWLFAGEVTHVTCHLFLKQGKDTGLDIEVATTTKWDAKLRTFAGHVAAHPGRVFVRPMGEMSGWWNGAHVAHAVTAYRKVVRFLDEAIATNAATVWCYCPSAPDDFAPWYPGDDAVDWFGLDPFEARHFFPEGSQRSRTEAFLAMARAHGKPVIISESSSVDVPMANATWSAWFGPWFEFLYSHPEIRWWQLLSHDWKALSGGPATWADGDVTHNPAILARLTTELSDGRWVCKNAIGELAP